jgi:hypothetical protein
MRNLFSYRTPPLLPFGLLYPIPEKFARNLSLIYRKETFFEKIPYENSITQKAGKRIVKHAVRSSCFGNHPAAVGGTPFSVHSA